MSNPAGSERYKFKDLKVYGSGEWIYGNQKNYHQVYDQSSLSYVYAELTLYNKQFDDEDWETDVLIRGINGVTGQTFCELKPHVKVNKTDHIVYIREGWGTDAAGQYWREGKYRYVAFIDGTQLAETHFYVVNKGPITQENNPYFSITSLKLFGGPGTVPAVADRRYMKAFKQETLCYLWCEVKIENKLPAESMVPFEMIVRFYYDTGQQRGEVSVLRFLQQGEKTLEICEGWGTEKPGAGWSKDTYTAEIDCMGTPIAIRPFQVGSEDIADDGQPFTMPGVTVIQQPGQQAEPQTFEEAAKELDELIGLGSVKEQIHDLATYLKFVKLRKEKGLEDDGKINLNAVFTGNPGTGKTTVARLLGKIYRTLGLLSKGHVHEVDRAALVAQYIGQTAPLAKEAIEKARGGILFVDEAYSLTSRHSERDFGSEVIEILLKEMSDGPGNLAMIFAGYPAPMLEFVNANPGLKSRISTVLDFPDYTPDELMEIADYSARKQGVTIAVDAKDLMHKHVVEGYRNRNEQFGNARFINSIIGESKMNLGKRIMKASDPTKLPEAELSTITLKDVEDVFKSYSEDYLELPVDQDLLNAAMAELAQLTGMTNVKQEIEEAVKLVRYYRDIGRNLRTAFSTNIVFTGNPGTGKTTVARILVKIYKALGILERGHLVEVDRERMVAGYIGQTAPKTAALIDQAMGGGLFIDEAYSLARGDNDSGHEAVETLLKRMEDSRGQFAVIVAGYPEEMMVFLESNPGLKSRFDKTITFIDYDAAELWQIALVMFSKEDLKPDAEAEVHLKGYVSYLHSTRNKFFGNARAVRKIVEDVVRKQHLRMAALAAKNRTPEMIETVTLADVEHLKETRQQSRIVTIGFTAGS